jgi:hypothetical protein
VVGTWQKHILAPDGHFLQQGCPTGKTTLFSVEKTDRFLQWNMRDEGGKKKRYDLQNAAEARDLLNSESKQGKPHYTSIYTFHGQHTILFF